MAPPLVHCDYYSLLRLMLRWEGPHLAFALSGLAVASWAGSGRLALNIQHAPSANAAAAAARTPGLKFSRQYFATTKLYQRN